MNLHVLGVGTPDPEGMRFGSAFVLETAGQYLMIDCGPAAVYKLARLGIRPTQVDRLLFTHHHFDHNLDYPCFLLTRWDQDTGFQPGLVEQTDDWTITAVAVRHLEPWLIEYGYKVQTAEGTVAFTGDAGPCPGLDDLAAGADVLVMCCAHIGTVQPLTASVVTGAQDVARVASRAGVKTVVLTHIPATFDAPGRREKMIATVAERFSGLIIFGNEVTTLKLA